MAVDDQATYLDSPGGKILAVAVCYWNGTAWAGPSPVGSFVQTAGGPMMCAAFFNWNGSTYTAQSTLGN